MTRVDCKIYTRKMTPKEASRVVQELTSLVDQMAPWAVSGWLREARELKERSPHLNDSEVLLAAFTGGVTEGHA